MSKAKDSSSRKIFYDQSDEALKELLFSESEKTGINKALTDFSFGRSSKGLNFEKLVSPPENTYSIRYSDAGRIILKKTKNGDFVIAAIAPNHEYDKVMRSSIFAEQVTTDGKTQINPAEQAAE